MDLMPNWLAYFFLAMDLQKVNIKIHKLFVFNSHIVCIERTKHNNKYSEAQQYSIIVKEQDL